MLLQVILKSGYEEDHLISNVKIALGSIGCVDSAGSSGADWVVLVVMGLFLAVWLSPASCVLAYE